MSRGRKTNWDARVSALVAELRTALVEREKTRLEARVDAMVAGIGHGLDVARDGVSRAVAKVAGRAKGAGAMRKRGVYKRSAASRKAQAEKMRAYWAARKKAGTAKRGGRKAKRDGKAPVAAAELEHRNA
jgi:hypothetical protein